MFATSSVGFFPIKKAAGALEKAKDAASKASKNSLFIFVTLMVLELIPAIGSVVPSILINSIMTIISSREEDKSKDQEIKTNQNVIRQKNQVARDSGNPNTIRSKKS
jgi:hypothetical protein